MSENAAVELLLGVGIVLFILVAIAGTWSDEIAEIIRDYREKKE